ncbi:MAG: sigma-70 family RNA polymerase sigma factor, partial [Tidjanibacter sp.]|nr:sigma-70 family RNA polymerase sigma factor [Tidjanibacter sp.]
ETEKLFTSMVEEQKQTIYMICYLFSKNPTEVEELYQDVLINLWKGFPAFEGRSSVRTWVWRVSLNTCITWQRKSRKKRLPLELSVDLYNDTDSDTRQIKMLHNRISQLGPFDRAIVLLWLENMTYEEIGEIVGISAKNVSVRLFRIKEQLRQMSNKHSEE